MHNTVQYQPFISDKSESLERKTKIFGGFHSQDRKQSKPHRKSKSYNENKTVTKVNSYHPKSANR
jgi:hypothetical protein